MSTDFTQIERTLESLISPTKMGFRYTVDLSYMSRYDHGMLVNVEITEIISTHKNEYLILARAEDNTPLTIWQHELLELSEPKKVRSINEEETDYQKESLAGLLSGSEYVLASFDYADVKAKNFERLTNVRVFGKNEDSNLVNGVVAGDLTAREFFWGRISNVHTLDVVYAKKTVTKESDERPAL